jgi:polyribonucleotide nucleotidyltransferase
MEEKIFSGEWLGRTLTIKTGKLALQADASVLVQYGETVVMANVVQSKTERDGIEFFPLMVEFEEKLYAAGIIKGSRWLKREGRPTDDAVLTGRMIDRSIRPLFNQEDRRDIQVITSVMSYDLVNDYDVTALIAASAVLAISGIDWKGPLGGVRVGLIDGQLVYNPTMEQQINSTLDLIVSGTEHKSIMIEAGGKEIPEDLIYEAIIGGQKAMQPAIELIKKMQAALPKKVKAEKKVLKSEAELEKEAAKKELLVIGEEWLKENINKTLFNKEFYTTKGERKGAIVSIKQQLDEFLFERGYEK